MQIISFHTTWKQVLPFFAFGPGNLLDPIRSLSMPREKIRKLCGASKGFLKALKAIFAFGPGNLLDPVR